MPTNRTAHAAARYLPVLLLLVAENGCGIKDSINDIIAQIQRTQEAIVGQSDAWRAALPKLVDQIGQIERQASADVKGVILDARNQVQALANDTIKFADISAQEIVAKTGVEYRCNAAFTASGVSARLQYLIDDLKFWKLNRRHKPEKPIHAICQILGDTLPLYPLSGGGFGIDSRKLVGPNVVKVFGYNFRGDALPMLDLVAADSSVTRRLNVVPAYVTQYELTLDFGSENFADAIPGARVVFRWPDRGEPNTISLAMAAPARLKFTEPCKFDPEHPTAVQHRVSLQVTVTNVGKEMSGAFRIQWTPQGGRTIYTSQEPLRAEETRKLWFPEGYVYQLPGLNMNDVMLENGDDSLTCAIIVQAAPLPTPGPPPPPITDHDTRFNNLMHDCPGERFMSGIHRANDFLLCEWYGGARGKFVDNGTQRSGMHACPSGYAMTGLHIGNNQLVCGQLNTHNEWIAYHSRVLVRFGMGACPEGAVMTGYHADDDNLLCAWVLR